MPGVVRLQPAYDDPQAVHDLINGAGPFWPLARYAASTAELEAMGSTKPSNFVPPWFRQDFALLGEAIVPAAETILHNPHFVAAAHGVYGTDAAVRPTTVYVNLMGATPFPFVPHLDVPAFRGVTRVDHPIWLLQQMRAAGIFEPWRVRIATAVSWFWPGPGGDFHYWPAGADGPHEVESPPFDNVAIVADNEMTYHGVAPVVGDDELPTALTIHAQLVRNDDGWTVIDGGVEQCRYARTSMRATVSWKADVFADADEMQRADDHVDDLTTRRVVDMLLADLRGRGVDVAAPDDPFHDAAWVSAIAGTYRSPAPRITG
ncbi:MAG: hypothetical protein JWM34_1209 [Ilumatobacteraceae bacterium]|nr:hypothetical protein [Ilumatobacteraceae bacterium]